MGVGGAEDVDSVGEEGGGCGYEAESWGVIGVGFRLPRVMAILQRAELPQAHFKSLSAVNLTRT